MAVDVGICWQRATLSDRDAREHAWGHAHCSSESWNGTKAGRASTGVGKSVCSESASDVDSSELDEGWRRLDAVMALVRCERSGTTGVDWAASGVIAVRGKGWPDGIAGSCADLPTTVRTQLGVLNADSGKSNRWFLSSSTCVLT